MNLTVFVGANRLCIKPDLPPDELKALRKAFTFVVYGHEFTTQHRLYGWDGSVCLVQRNQEIPLGCLYRVRKHLENRGFEVKIVYSHDCVPNGEIGVADLSLEEFQIKAVKKALKYRYGVIMAPVRAGKTAIAGALVNAVGHYPAWVVTYGKDLVLQTRLALEGHLGRKVGYFSESEYIPNNIVVTSYQALTAAFSKRSKVKFHIKSRNAVVKEQVKNAKIVVLDECHHAISRKFFPILNSFQNAFYRIGLSATPKPDKISMLEFESKIGSVFSRIKYKTLIDEGRLAKPIVLMYNMPYAWYTSYLKTYNDVLVSNLVDNQMRNRFIAQIAERLKEKDKTVFIKVTRIDHGNNLNDMIPGSVFVKGAMDSSIRKQIYQSLQDKVIHCVIATVGKEGLNLPKLDATINAEGLRSKLANKQKMRSLTSAENKSYGLIIDFLDKGKYLQKQGKIRLAMYKSMPGFIIREKRVPKDLFPMEATRWELKSKFALPT